MKSILSLQYLLCYVTWLKKHVLEGDWDGTREGGRAWLSQISQFIHVIEMVFFHLATGGGGGS